MGAAASRPHLERWPGCVQPRDEPPSGRKDTRPPRAPRARASISEMLPASYAGHLAVRTDALQVNRRVGLTWPLLWTVLVRAHWIWGGARGPPSREPPTCPRQPALPEDTPASCAVVGRLRCRPVTLLPAAGGEHPNLLGGPRILGENNFSIVVPVTGASVPVSPGRTWSLSPVGRGQWASFPGKTVSAGHRPGTGKGSEGGGAPAVSGTDRKASPVRDKRSPGRASSPYGHDPPGGSVHKT